MTSAHREEVDRLIVRLQARGRTIREIAAVLNRIRE